MGKESISGLTDQSMKEIGKITSSMGLVTINGQVVESTSVIGRIMYLTERAQ